MTIMLLGIISFFGLLAIAQFNNLSSLIILTAFLLFISAMVIIYSKELYDHLPEGIKNNGNWNGSLTGQGTAAWILGFLLTGFYILLYWFPQLLGLNSQGNTGIIGFFDPFSQFLKNKPASEWFVYGTLYTLIYIYTHTR